MADEDLTDVDVRVVNARGEEDDWVIPVDPTMDPEELLPDLVEVLALPGPSTNYSIRMAGSLAHPILLISEKKPRIVGSPKRRTDGHT